MILTNGEANEIIIWDIKKKKTIRKLESHTSSVTALAVLPDGLIISGSLDGEIKLWNPNETV
jgi:WD40 repeat protein